MKTYEKPIIISSEIFSEGVYMASGSDCYSVTVSMIQSPETGRGDYRFKLDGKHHANDSHTTHKQILTLTFNQAVIYKSGGKYLSGSGTPIIEIEFNYFNNSSDNIGLADIYVESDQGLSTPTAVLTCIRD